MTVSKNIQEIAEAARRELAATLDEASLESWRIAHLGRKAPLTAFLRSLGELPSDERRSGGEAANRLKKELDEALAVRRSALETARIAKTVETGGVDVSLPGRPSPTGGYIPSRKRCGTSSMPSSLRAFR